MFVSQTEPKKSIVQFLFHIHYQFNGILVYYISQDFYIPNIAEISFASRDFCFPGKFKSSPFTEYNQFDDFRVDSEEFFPNQFQSFHEIFVFREISRQFLFQFDDIFKSFCGKSFSGPFNELWICAAFCSTFCPDFHNWRRSQFRKIIKESIWRNFIRFKKFRNGFAGFYSIRFLLPTISKHLMCWTDHFRSDLPLL